MYRHAAGNTSSSFLTSSSGLSRSCTCTFRSRNSMTSPSACANTNLPPRATTGTLRAPSLRSSSIPAGLPWTLIDSYSTPLLVRNSLVLRQLVHPGCQKTLTLSAARMLELSDQTVGIALGSPAVNKRITRIFQQIHAGMRKSRPPSGRGRAMITRWIPVLAMAAAAGAFAQDFPSRPVRIVVPWPPSGNIDITARTVAPAFSEALGQQVIVENRAGAGGRIGTTAVAKSPADG